MTLTIKYWHIYHSLLLQLLLLYLLIVVIIIINDQCLHILIRNDILSFLLIPPCHSWMLILLFFNLSLLFNLLFPYCLFISTHLDFYTFHFLLCWCFMILCQASCIHRIRHAIHHLTHVLINSNIVAYRCFWPFITSHCIILTRQCSLF